MDSHQDPAGFSPHVNDQLQHLAASQNQQHQRGNRRAFQQQRSYESGIDPALSQQQPQQPQSYPYNSQYNRPPGQPTWGHQTPTYPGDDSNFPPLGAASQQPANRGWQNHRAQNHYPHHQSHFPSEHAPTTQHAYSDRGRRNNNHRGARRGAATQAYQTPRNQPYQSPQPHQLHPNSFQRSAPNQGQLYAANAHAFFDASEQRHAHKQRIMMQSDFLSSLANVTLRNQITKEELQAKEAFQRKIQAMVRTEIRKAYPDGLDFNVDDVWLRLYGSLGSGFGVAGSDMDLLLVFPQHQVHLNGIEIESRRLLEKALLEAGHGARLLTNTRVPILKVCEQPSPDLLQALRETRQQWEDDELQGPPVTDDLGSPPPPDMSAQDAADITHQLAEIALIAVSTPLPPESAVETTKLEFTKNCGIQCDINFTNYVALRNTELLRTYGQFDPRVRQVGLFVKNWAKARDINTPYKGTLSSYGYIMLVLHYLMNVVDPPVLPNLQAIAKAQAGWQDAKGSELIEGFDVRFVRDHTQLSYIKRDMPVNKETVGSLLRGFYWYYASKTGYHWSRDVISIRSPRGLISKAEKGWTGAKWQEGSQHVRLRYLLAIEDPFEVEHNIGRTVGHNGVVAIRDEFRRAWSMISSVKLGEDNRTWLWLDRGETKDADEFMAVVQDRGDLLRKDQAAHRDRLRSMRLDVEAKHQALQISRPEDDKDNGMWTEASSDVGSRVTSIQNSDHRSTRLIHDHCFQDKSREWKRQSSRRQTQAISDDSDDDEPTATAVTWTPRPVPESGWNTVPDQQSTAWIDAKPAAQMSSAEPTMPVQSSWSDDCIDGWDETKAGAGLGDSNFDSAFAKWFVPPASDNTDPTEYTSAAISSRSNIESEPTEYSEPATAAKDEFAGDEMSGEAPQETAEEAAMREEIKNQRQNQYETLGDQVFVRNVRVKPHLEPHSHPPRADKKVGKSIQWDVGTDGGRWLRWRDRAVLAGSWTRPRNPDLADLDMRFPYDPEMSYADLEQKNLELRKFYHKSMRRAIDTDPPKRPEPDWAMRALKSSLHPVAERNTPPPPPNLPPQPRPYEAEVQARAMLTDVPAQLHPSSEPRTGIASSTHSVPQAELTPVSAEDAVAPSLEALRAIRLKYYCPQAASTTAETQTSLEKASSSTHSVAGLSSTDIASARNVPRESAMPPRKVDTDQADGSASATNLTYEEINSRAWSAHAENWSGFDDHQVVSEPATTEVPRLTATTLRSTRTVETHAVAVPVTQSLGFNFDPRQLAAIQIMRNGGNGCARPGEEFNVEENGSWSHSGPMSYRSSNQAVEPTA